ncbi:alpha/beta fold hydrolase [Pedobacter duraquae]|uniref:Alpha/beta hydrolase family protein n=1 Tax=Pedobacter duraquae TaxID=425511 RepID=A0A4R6IL97_9SPHI|nr:alpha/beta hydrolase [Pedobacter duraquae]TDO22725.1 alpha/beta hydrolase family protein [Pedobacter duraquae]
MKILKQIIAEIKSAKDEDTDQLQDLILRYICYAPKMPLRVFQENLLERAEITKLRVHDEYFSGQELTFQAFKWGKGSRKILLTHGWGSKAADLSDIIVALEQIGDVEIIAFDAPGNGVSEGKLSSLLLFAESVKAIVAHHGIPEVTIGHSLGATANIIAMQQLGIHPKQIISIAPLIDLGKNFEASMDAIDIPKDSQNAFFQSFEERFKKPVSNYNLVDWSAFTTESSKHWVAYDENDLISPYLYMNTFLNSNSFIESTNYIGAGHERIIKSPIMIQDMLKNLS